MSNSGKLIHDFRDKNTTPVEDMYGGEVVKDSSEGYLHMKLDNGERIPVRGMIDKQMSESEILTGQSGEIRTGSFLSTINNCIIKIIEGKYRVDIDSLIPDLKVKIVDDTIIHLGNLSVYLIGSVNELTSLIHGAIGVGEILLSDGTHNNVDVGVSKIVKCDCTNGDVVIQSLTKCASGAKVLFVKTDSTTNRVVIKHEENGGFAKEEGVDDIILANKYSKYEHINF